MQKISGRGQHKTSVQTVNEFFVHKDEDMLGDEDGNQKQTYRQVKPCSVCRVQKNNHIVKEFANEESQG